MSGHDVLFDVAASGLRAQSARMRIIAENVANANSTGRTAEEDPYRRRVAVLEAVFDPDLGAHVARMTRSDLDRSDFTELYKPGHPAANADGMVKYPNVQMLLEMMDMRAAQRAYEANLNIVETGRSMNARTLDLLRR